MRGILVAILLAVLVAPSVAADPPAPPTSAPATFGPRGVHLAWRADATIVAFTWPAAAEPVVHWTRATGETGEAVATDAGSGTFVASVPADVARYAIGERVFDVAPRPADGAGARVAFVADVGTTRTSRETVEAILRANVSLLLVGGDLSYANGRNATWDAWLDLMEPVASRVPMMTALGNHETYCSIVKGRPHPCPVERRGYDERFPMPNAPHAYYAFDWGAARFVALDSETVYLPEWGGGANESASERAFLDSTLASAGDRWRIAFYHRPVYSSAKLHPSDPTLQREFASVFDARGLDLALQGHQHDYERSWPILARAPVVGANETLRGAGTVYVVSGGGGESIYEAWDEPAPAWSAARASTPEFVLLDVTRDRVDARALAPNGTAIDAFSIVAHAEEAGGGPRAQPHATPRTLAAAGALAVAALAVAGLARRRPR